jgi:carbamoyl-phosphate synthase large subunit
LDYIVVKAPRFAFEKFPDADPRLTTTMKSVGEAMAIGRSFPEALDEGATIAGTQRSNFQFPADISQINMQALLAIHADSNRISSTTSTEGHVGWRQDRRCICSYKD